MSKLKITILPIYFITIIFTCVFVFTTIGSANSAKQKYLKADSCYKKLRHSASKQKKATEWLNCISRYEIIYRLHPESAWAPAGMYKAAQLYLTLSKLSGKKIYKNHAADLLARIRNKYPRSAYHSLARSLLKSIETTPSLYTKKIKHIPSKKRLTKNDTLIKKFIQNGKKTVKQKITSIENTNQKTNARKPAAAKKNHYPDCMGKILPRTGLG